MAGFFFEQDGREGGGDAEAAGELLAGFLEDAVEEFQAEGSQPSGGAADMAAVEVEDGAYADHDAVGEMGEEVLHELFLFGGAEGDPYDLNPGGVEFPGNGPVVELFCREEGEFHEGHVRHGGIPRGDGGPQAVQDLCIAAQKGHAVMAGAYQIPEDLRPAVMGTADAVKAAQEDRNPRAVADGEQGFVNRPAVVCIPVHEGEDIGVRHADIAGLALRDGLPDFAVYRLRVEFIANVEEGFHLRQGEE